MMLSEGKLVAVGLITLLQACILSVCVAKKYQPCSTSLCGDVTISDPFWLKGNNQSGCGDPNYKLACENNRTTLELYKGRYYVANIDYTNHTIRIVDPGLEKGSCFSSPHYYLTFQNFSPRDPYSLPSEWGSDSTVFLKCAVQISDHNYIPITPCNNSNGTSSSSQTYAYALVGDDIRVSDIPYSCTIGRSLITQSKEVSGHRNRSMSHLQEKQLMGLELSFLKVLCSTLCTENCTLDFNQNLVDCGEYDAANVMQDAVNCFLLLIAIMMGARGVVAIMGLLTHLIHMFQRRYLSLDDSIEEFLRRHKNLQPIRYSYSDIKKMTRGFQNKLGQGGFGTVYKGKLRNGHMVAVKMCNVSKANGQDFINEVATIGRIHHANVVRLIGFCVEGSKCALLYDFMPNGSLDKFVFLDQERSTLLSWDRLYKIALGVGRGIEYLHQGCDMQILHFDIKPHNILLDQNFNPKVSDFGLAKLYSTDKNTVTFTIARGTLGYIAPELFYQNIGGVSYKADVYSFGMLLLEMVGRRRNVNVHAEHSSQIYFSSWIYDKFHQEKDVEVRDATEDEKRLIKKMVIVALWCIQMKPTDRPSMSKALEMLEGDVELLSMPLKPTVHPMEISDEDRMSIPIGVPISSRNAMDAVALDGS